MITKSILESLRKKENPFIGFKECKEVTKSIIKEIIEENPNIEFGEFYEGEKGIIKYNKNKAGELFYVPKNLSRFEVENCTGSLYICGTEINERNFKMFTIIYSYTILLRCGFLRELYKIMLTNMIIHEHTHLNQFKSSPKDYLYRELQYYHNSNEFDDYENEAREKSSKYRCDNCYMNIDNMNILKIRGI